MKLNNKEKSMVIVKFTDDYYSKARKEVKGEKGEITRPAGQPIYRKNEEAAMHKKIAAGLKEKGAKFNMLTYDKEKAVKRRQKAMKESDRMAYKD